MRPFLAAALAVVASGPAAAQSVFGDTQLSYQDGIVYDDDLVPGRGPNASFLVEEQSPQPLASRGYEPSFDASTTLPSASRNLVGADGRAVPAR